MVQQTKDGLVVTIPNVTWEELEHIQKSLLSIIKASANVPGEMQTTSFASDISNAVTVLEALMPTHEQLKMIYE